MPKPLWQMMTGLPTYRSGAPFGCIVFPTKAGDVQLPIPGSDGEFYVRNLRTILDLQVRDVDHPATA